MGVPLDPPEIITGISTLLEKSQGYKAVDHKTSLTHRGLTGLTAQFKSNITLEYNIVMCLVQSLGYVVLFAHKEMPCGS